MSCRSSFDLRSKEGGGHKRKKGVIPFLTGVRQTSASLAVQRHRRSCDSEIIDITTRNMITSSKGLARSFREIYMPGFWMPPPNTNGPRTPPSTAFQCLRALLAALPLFFCFQDRRSTRNQFLLTCYHGMTDHGTQSCGTYDDHASTSNYTGMIPVD